MPTKCITMETKLPFFNVLKMSNVSQNSIKEEAHPLSLNVNLYARYSVGH